jgi:hypothetical protein
LKVKIGSKNRIKVQQKKKKKEKIHQRPTIAPSSKHAGPPWRAQPKISNAITECQNVGKATVMHQYEAPSCVSLYLTTFNFNNIRFMFKDKTTSSSM